MALSKNERWHVVPPGPLAPHLLTIRTKDGSYREPTADETEALKQMPAALEEALDHLRTLATLVGDAEKSEAVARRLAELLTR